MNPLKNLDFFKSFSDSILSLNLWTKGLIYIFAGYPLVDYMMRSVLGVPVLSSLWDEMVLVGLLGILLVVWWWGQAPAGDLRAAGVSLEWPLLLILLYGVFMLFFNLVDFSINVEGFRASFQYILVFFVGFYLVRSERVLYSALYIMLGIGLLLGLHGLFQYVVGAPMPSHWVEAGENVRTRAYSILGSPNVLGSYMAWASMLAAGLGLQRAVMVVADWKQGKNKNTRKIKSSGTDENNNTNSQDRDDYINSYNPSNNTDIDSGLNEVLNEVNYLNNQDISLNENSYQNINISKNENILNKKQNIFNQLINLIFKRLNKLTSTIYNNNLAMALILLGSAGVMLLTLLLTFSRGALLAWAGALVIVAVIIALWYDKRLIFALVGLGVLAVLALMLVAPAVVERMIFVFSPEYFAKSSQGGRVTRWLNALDKMRHEPFFGAGMGHYGGAVGARHFATIYVDNYYAKTWAEMGLIGISLFVWLMGALVSNVVRTWRRLWGGRHAMVVAGILGALLAVIFHNGVENIFEVPFMNVIFWLTAGMALAMPLYLAEDDRDNKQVANIEHEEDKIRDKKQYTDIDSKTEMKEELDKKLEGADMSKSNQKVGGQTSE